ncbi:MAG: DEAD/DEAH box helicase [Candidatus Pristimantibacillus lignocellulolyticus]|uniref:DEAD/DEAH box helicase n=1 Tax=Candidatus Pristimantibacillus lignocellulolyticus TaxID=2994561 RepID=A0A9J6ZEB4_9BACL|nr:MAG: DEAD/DEAH box helicase [Candidatus Pristimantibacillus lignocellulolyticus]
MKMSFGIQPLALDGIWGKREEKYEIILRVDGWKETTFGQLRSYIFGWHVPSWYGTEIEESKLNGRTILILTPKQALEFLAAPAPLSLLNIQYSERLLLLQQLAQFYLKCLENGEFEPETANWNTHTTAWRPLQNSVPIEQIDEWWEKAKQYGFDGIGNWFSHIVNDIIENESTVRRSWNALLDVTGDALLMNKVNDEEEWLTAVGFKEDVLPYKLAIALHEPTNRSKTWFLRTSIYNVNDEQWYSLSFNSAAQSWSMINSDGIATSINEPWSATLHEKLQRERLRYQSVIDNTLISDEYDVLQHPLTEDEAWKFLEYESAALLSSGCKVILPAWWESVKNRKLKMKGKVKSSLGSAAEPMFGLDQIVQFDWKFAIGDKEISEDDFMSIAASNRKLVQLGDQWVYLSAEDVAQVKKWLKNVHRKKGLTFSDVLQMHLRGEHADWIDEELDYDLDTEIELNDHLKKWLMQLQNVQDIPLIETPSTFLGELRPYQQQGASWLIFLRQFGLGAVLADDMGLGKTIQYMAYLSYVKHNQLRKSEAPSLLICPTSVIGNWERELKRFVPSLNIVLHYGTKRPRDAQFAQSIKDADLVITSYALAQIDSDDLQTYEWDSLCLDEAQNIKNAYTKQAGAIRKLQALQRIALTGTPMENRLTELWSIYDFINPGYLGSLYQFRKSMIAPIEREKDEKRIAGLQRWVKPFMLRRVKKDPTISLSLPEKQEAKSFMPLTTEQVSLYEGIVSELLDKLHKETPMQRRGLILGSLTKLKQLCDHPALLLHQETKKQWEITRSSKLERLVELVDEIAELGERCLIFTQYIEMGNQIQRILEQRYEIKVPYLHGAIPKQKRDEMIEAFQDEAIPHVAFVLSLKAGGTGLNLTAANHVIHFDRWWNPAVENQATDRAFRIGQTRQVQVHKFITIGTLEEKIDEMIDGKQQLNDQIVRQSDQWITELSTDDLKELFTLRDSWLKE